MNGGELYTLKNKVSRVAAELPLLPRALGLVRKAAKGWFAAWIVLLLMQGLLPVALVYLSRSVVNSLVLLTRASAPLENAWPALRPAILLAATLLAAEVLRSATSYVKTVQSELLRDDIRSLIQEKSVAMDLEVYDSPEFYDHLHAWRRSVTSDERRTWYYEWLLTTAEPAAEIRLFDLGGYFQKASLASRTRLRQERLSLTQRQALAETGAGAAALVITGSSVLWTAWSAIQGRASLGDLVLLYQAFHQGLQLTKSVLGHLGQIYSNVLFLGNLFEFLDLAPLVIESPSARLQ